MVGEGCPARISQEVRAISNQSEPGGASRSWWAGAPSSRQHWLRRLAGHVLRYRRNATLAFGAAVFGTAIAAVTPLIERAVIDNVVVAHRQPLAPYVLALLAAGVLRFAAGFVRRYIGGRLALDVQYDLRDALFTALTRLDGVRQDGLRTGQVVSRANSDVTVVQGLLAFLPLMSGNLLLFVLAIVIMMLLSPLLTLLALAVGPLVIIIGLRARRTVFPATWAAQQQAGEVAAVVAEATAGVRVVKGFGQEERELAKLATAARALFSLRMRAVRFTSLYTSALAAVPALGQVGMLALGGWLALRGSISLGTFLAFTAYLGELVAPTRMLAGLLTIGQQARASAIRVFEVMDSQPVVTERPGARDLTRARGCVELANVTFGYSRDRPVLDGVSLRIEPGQTLALVGASGSGKSTVAALLSRYYDTDTGALRLDGHDIRELALPSLRAQIAMVFEDSFLFSDSVRANISYGRPDADEASVVAAARAAHADGFIRALPAGYDTVVGEQGLTLSGGQRQRIALARALLTDSPILVLDDATSAVDVRVEAEIHAALRANTRGRTTLLIAHRRSTLQLADRIAVLDAGRLVDIGTDEELSARCELYTLLLDGRVREPAVTTPRPRQAPATGVGGPRPVPLGPLRPRPAEASGGGGQRVLGGVAGDMPATPELLARVEALPPATEAVGVRMADAAAGDPAFSLRRLLGGVRALLALGLLLVVLDAGTGLALPALVRHGVDAGVSRTAGAALVMTSAVALAVVLTAWAVQVSQGRVAGRLGERLLFTLRVKTFAQLQRLGLDYYERELSGRIMTRMTTDVDALSTFLQTGLTTAVVGMLSFVGVGVALVVLNARLALVVLPMVPVGVFATVVFRAKASAAYVESRERVAAVNAALQENLAGIRVVQAFRREGRNIADFRALAERYRVSRLRAQRLIALYFPFMEFCSELAAALVLGAGAGLVASGSLTTGGLIAYLLYLGLFFSPIQQLSQVFDGYQQAKVGLRRLSDLLRTPTSTPARPAPVPVGRLSGEIEFVGVCFRYAGAERPALDGVNLRVAAGETVALVGETGAGKSTVVKLAARFYDATGGVVRIDGTDVTRLDLAGYRHRLGVVPQEPFLFAGTVRDTIAYARPDAADAEVRAAARAVGAHEMIMRLPGGYLHRIGENGRGLSAGQRQLLALARAELADPDILLLDEATASLDLATEAAVTEATDRVARRRTTLVVAHRLTTAARADRVVVMAAGRIVEQGSHAQLIGAQGRYARMWAEYSGAGAPAGQPL
ncbi:MULTISPECIES: ABC transporter ATP-binding protein [unclassified Frankia]|uniref:ABC transporter ATP-binding protein n=1 Tax=unclassified Frankia TaxID=2632575 RepID=UPI001EF4CA25|nr:MULTISPECIES: ABC transporter ATP-binding protein [unclassified Frankia]